MSGQRRPVATRRSWLFVPGADEDALNNAPHSGADVACQELEDFTPPEKRAEARELSPDILTSWREAGMVTAVRINPLEECGHDDLEAAMPGRPHAVYLPKVSASGQIIRLDAEIERLEEQNGIEPGSTEIIPNIESALGLTRTYIIATSSARVSACLVASEDMAADLGAERGQDSAELDYVRARFHLECTAAGVLSIDCPYTWSDETGVKTEALHARRLGYRAKSAVAPAHAAVINGVFTPSAAEIAGAKRIIEMYEAARARGDATTEIDGNLVELPTYLTANRLLDRAREFGLG